MERITFDSTTEDDEDDIWLPPSSEAELDDETLSEIMRSMGLPTSFKSTKQKRSLPDAEQENYDANGEPGRQRRKKSKIDLVLISPYIFLN